MRFDGEEKSALEAGCCSDVGVMMPCEIVDASGVCGSFGRPPHF